eukprot:CAMPEP_0116134262 /NCGR_PEP_ID=MMETSP0329-20121206/10551_1 /TAXON_ID=697910 /ORGANISM="Pseudo-nitzschia arenysensis, Strain B593" /LENGTH=247 /DNA_ID=CAMNT_0003628959 /DNA_START=32 /DNA_END=775 /DNA_ORIENTATION=+
MTAAVMAMPNTSRYGVAFGESSLSNRSPDLLERFFSGWEGVFCTTRSVETLSKQVVEEPILLDYVFDHVESFTCADDMSYQDDPFLLTPSRRQHTHPGYPEDASKDSYDLALKRENSLVEQGPNGAPAYMLTTRQPNRIAGCGKEGDLLDYCFEHVESFVCNNEPGDYHGDRSQSKSGKSSQRTPMRNTTNHQRRQQTSPEISRPIPRVISTPRKKKKKRRNRHKQNYYPDEEDNILLYYRPMKTDQ